MGEHAVNVITTNTSPTFNDFYLYFKNL